MTSLTKNHFSYDHIRNISKVITAWLSYFYAVSPDASHLVAESTVRYPITGYLERRKDVTVSMEYPIEEMQRKRYDFFWEKQSGESCILEVKYQRQDSVKKQEIFDDLLRIALGIKDKRYGYFMLCGKAQDINNKILKVRTNAIDSNKNSNGNKIQGVRNTDITPTDEDLAEWFDICNNKFSLSDKTVKISPNNTFFEDFKKNYGTYKIIAELESIEFKTRLIQEVSPDLDCIVAIWEIFDVVKKQKKETLPKQQ